MYNIIRYGMWGMFMLQFGYYKLMSRSEEIQCEEKAR